MTHVHKKTDFTREQPLHPPRALQKPAFMTELTHYTSFCMHLIGMHTALYEL